MNAKEIFCLKIIGDSNFEILTVLSNKKNEYEKIEIPKKKGYRKIYCLKSNSKIKRYQQNLINNFFSHYPIPVVAKGFVEGENYFSYMKEHVGSNYFLRIDIKDFFESIKYEHFENFMYEMETFKDKNNEGIIKIIWNIISYNDYLVQGAVSSPMISNLIFRRTDQRILKYCQELGIKYTRYADDLLFSSSNFEFKKKKWFLKKINYILRQNKFQMNCSKLKCCDYQISLNGFVISYDNIRLSRKKYHDISQVVWYVNKSDIYEKNFFDELHKLGFYNNKLRTINTYYSLIQYLCVYRSFLIGSYKECEMGDDTKRKIEYIIKKIDMSIIKVISNKYPTYWVTK